MDNKTISKIEKLKQLMALVSNDTVTPSELKGFLELVLSVIKKSKDEFDSLSKENIDLIKNSIEYIKKESSQTISKLDIKAEKSKEELDTLLKEARAFLIEVKNIKVEKGQDGKDGKDGIGKDGKDGRDGKDGSPDTGEDIVNKINDLPLDEDKKIDAKHVKGLPEVQQFVSRGGGNTEVFKDGVKVGSGQGLNFEGDGISVTHNGNRANFKLDLSDLYLKPDQTTPQTTVGTFTFPIIKANSADITGSLTANNLWYLNGNTLGSKKLLGSIDNQDFGIVTNNTERLTVSKDGNVGIGTTNPLAKLHLVDGNMYFSGASNGGATINPNIYNVMIGPKQTRSGIGNYMPGIAFNHLLNWGGSHTYDSYAQAWIGTRVTSVSGSELADLVFATKTTTGVGPGNYATEKMTITSGGNVGIGTTSPSTKLQINGEITKGSENSIVSGVVFTQTADKTIANTITETSLFGTGVGSATLPANTLVAGKTVRVRLKGYLSGANGTDATIKVKLGSTTLVTSLGDLPATIENAYYEAEFEFTCRTSGASGTVIGQGRTIIVSGIGIVTSFTRALQMTSPATINTTTSQLADVTYTWGTADSGNTITNTNLSIEILN